MEIFNPTPKQYKAAQAENKRNFKKGVATGSISLGASALGVGNIIYAKKKIKILKSDKKKAMELYKRSKSKEPFNIWRKQQIRLLELSIKISGASVALGGLGAAGSAYTANIYRKGYKKNKETFKNIPGYED